MFEESQIDPALAAIGVSPTPTSPPGPILKPSIILLNGFPGVGKLTIATQLIKYLKASYPSPFHLVDRNLLVEPVQAVEPEYGPKHRQLVKNVRKAVLDGIKEMSDSTATIIMTEYLSTREASKHMFQEYLDVAQSRGLPLIYVEITCSTRENMARVANSKRARYVSKLLDKEVLQGMVLSDTLIDPADVTKPAGVEILMVDLWTGNLTAEKAALNLFRSLEALLGPEKQ